MSLTCACMRVRCAMSCAAKYLKSVEKAKNPAEQEQIYNKAQSEEDKMNRELLQLLVTGTAPALEYQQCASRPTAKGRAGTARLIINLVEAGSSMPSASEVEHAVQQN